MKGVCLNPCTISQMLSVCTSPSSNAHLQMSFGEMILLWLIVSSKILCIEIEH